VKVKLFVLLLLAAVSYYNVYSQCTTGCTFTISSSSNTAVSLASGDMLCITGGTFTGQVNFTNSFGSRTICIGTGATFNPTSINNSNNPFVLNNYGTFNLSASISLVTNSQINNYGTLVFQQIPNLNGTCSFYNSPTASMQFNNSFQLQSNSTFINDGYVRSLQDFSINNGCTFTNNQRVRTEANFNPSGLVTNNGIVVAVNFININGGTLINNCRLVAVQGFNNSVSTTQNNGLIWVPGGAAAAPQIQNNGALLNNGYVRAPRLNNSGPITNTNGFIRIEGGPNSNESVNNGSISGGTIGDITNAGLVPPYRFDTQGTLNGVTLGNVAAYDTLSPVYTTNCSPVYTGPVGFAGDGRVYLDANALVDLTVNGTPIAEPATQQLYVNVLNAANNVAAKVAVSTIAPNVGKFSFASIASGTYTFQLSTVEGIINSVAPAGTVPSGWVFTGEYQGIGAGDDATPDGRLSIIISAATSNLNFGIQQMPTGADYTPTPQSNPGFTNTILVPAIAFTGTDVEDGGSYPVGLNGRKVRMHPATNGTLYYNGVPVNAVTDFPGFNPNLVTLDPIDGANITTSFGYQVYDNANVPSVVKSINLGFLQNSVTLRLRVLLEGATLGNIAPFLTTMRDNLRNSPFTSLNYIPTTDPYTHNAAYNTNFIRVGDGSNPDFQTIITPATMFADRGTTSAVDWIFIELRSKANPATVLGTRSAIVQRDGSVVDVDGTNCIRFPSLPADDYYVAVRHRNHLGAMSATAVTADTLNCSSEVDFTIRTPEQLWNSTGYNGYEMKFLSGNRRALWAGDVNADRKVKYTAPNDDLFRIFNNVLNHPGNSSSDYNYDFGYGYIAGDVDMNSKVKYTAPGDDAFRAFVQLLGYGLNTGSDYNYDFFLEQLP